MNGLLTSYYEVEAELNRVYKTMQNCAGFSAPWDDPLIKEAQQLENTLAELYEAIKQERAAELMAEL